MLFDILVVGFCQIHQHTQRDVRGESALSLHQQNEFVPNLKAQVIVLADGQDILQCHQPEVLIPDIGILRVQRQV